MAVAKSYENMKIMGEPFTIDNKLYVIVQSVCKRCGGSGHYSMNAMGDSTCYRCHGIGKENLQVRWYTESQRASMDRAAEKRAEAKAEKKEERRIKFAARNAFGFCEAGYITLFKGDNNIINDWAHETNPCRARYNTLFGWFCPSKLEIVNLPDSITPVKLNWNMVQDPTDPEGLSIKDDDTVKKIIRELLGEINHSQYQGEVNEWLEKEVTVDKNISLDGHFGNSHMHIMHDAEGNEYVWNTASKNIEAGSKILLRMKVKEHKEYNGVKQTIVYYCKMKG